MASSVMLLLLVAVVVVVMLLLPVVEAVLVAVSNKSHQLMSLGGGPLRVPQ